jgi:cation:H+ antiporter
MGTLRLVFYILAFIALSVGSNLIVETIQSFTKRVRIPPFVFSFFVVGLLTSVGEIAVAINAISIHKPEIFVGSLLGGTLVIFSLIIPLTAILAHGIHIKKHLSGKNLLVTLSIIAAPSFFILDKTVTNFEAAVLIGLYVMLFYIIRAPKGALQKVESAFKRERKTLRENTLFRLSLGGLIVFLSSRFIVEQTVIYSEHFHISAFLVSLVVIALGMNLPELSLAIKAGSSRNAKIEDIAIGDFLGSAAANVVIFGVFTIINNGDVITASSFVSTFVFIVLVLASFFILTRGKSKLTSKEGATLAGFYCLFIATQFITR